MSAETTLVERFAQVFRAEHRVVRDELLELMQAFQAREPTRIRSLLDRIAADAGPHFRYEEEALYPALVEIFGPEYVEKLLGDHDRVIGTAGSLAALAAKAPLDDEDVAYGVRLVRSILPHVSDCDGLSIMVERLAPAAVQEILDARDRSLRDGLDLLEWAREVRRRPSVGPARAASAEAP